jgi:hypothetical protein
MEAVQLDHAVSQMPQSPAGLAGRWVAAGQGNEVRRSRAIHLAPEDAFGARRWTAACMPLLDVLAADKRNRRRADLHSPGDAFLDPAGIISRPVELGRNAHVHEQPVPRRAGCDQLVSADFL